MLPASPLPHRGAPAGTDPARDGRLAPGGVERRRPPLPGPRRLRHRQVEEGRRHHDRDRAGRRGEALAPFGQEAHDPVGGGQPEGRAAGEDHRVDPLHQPGGLQESGFPGGGRPTPDLTGTHRPRRCPDDRDPGVGPGPVPDPDAGDGGDGQRRRRLRVQPR